MTNRFCNSVFMEKKSIATLGLSGVALFTIASILGGFQFDNYNPISQYISETMAVDTPYGKVLRFFGYIPSGILLTIFSFGIIKKFPEDKLIKVGFTGLGLFYGVATIIVGIFPCDSGCNKEMIDPSASQLIHNLTGFLTYLFVPPGILLIGIGLQKFDKYHGLSKLAIACALISFSLFAMLLANPLTNYAGLYQRLNEGVFILWIVSCSVFLIRADKVKTLY